MKPTQAKEAFIKTIENITEEITKRGLNVNINCYFSDRELEPIDEANIDNASILSAVITVCAEFSDDAVVFEHAIAIDEGEVLNDEIIREANKLRESTRELCEKLDSGMSAKESIKAMDIEPEITERPAALDNRLYYIGGAIVVAIIILVIAFLK